MHNFVKFLSYFLFYPTAGQQKVVVGTVKLEDYFEDGLVNVSEALTSRSRFLYPKVAKTSVLDSLLSRRIALRSQEEKDLATKVSFYQ